MHFKQCLSRGSRASDAGRTRHAGRHACEAGLARCCVQRQSQSERCLAVNKGHVIEGFPCSTLPREFHQRCREHYDAPPERDLLRDAYEHRY
jgi:hypothetical protein